MAEKDPPIINLAAERKKFERDFSVERADLCGELKDLGVAEDRIAALAQHTMEAEWALFRAVAMLNYHDVGLDPAAVVRLVELILSSKSSC